MHPLLAELFRVWDAAGVRWALMRVPSDPTAPEGDLDILLEKNALEPAVAAARRLGFVPVPGQPDDSHLLQFHRQTGRWLWLHCATELAFGPYRCVRPRAETQVLAARRRDGGLARLDAGHEFWVTLLHALLDQRRLSARSRQRLQCSHADAPVTGPFAEAVRPLLPSGWTPERIVQCVSGQDWDPLDRLSPLMVAAALRSGRPALHRRALTRAGRLAARVAQAGRRRGVSVALLGPDGAGKSTLADGLRVSFVLPARQIYMGLTGGWLERVDRLRVPGLVRLGRLGVIWGRYLRGQYHTLRGRLVVFERYTFDAVAPTPMKLGRLARLARWLDGRACPAPDLVLILDAPGALMHQRKGEYTPEMLEHWRQRFRTLEHRLPSVAVLDTTQPPETVLADATQCIWRQYVRRWSRP